MVDTGTSVDTTPQIDEQAQQAAANKAELDMMMKINLNGGIVPMDVQQPSSEPLPPAAAAEPPPVTFEIIKEKFNYQSPDDAIREIEELRQLKANPKPAEFKFENEDSEKLFRAIAAGGDKRKEAYQILDKLERLESITSSDVTKENAEAIIKMSMQLNPTKLSAEEINFQFEELYGMPSKPIQKAEELDEEYQERLSGWQQQVQRSEMKRSIAAKMALPELEKAKSQIVFPEIENKVDQEYLQWKQLMEQQTKLDLEIQEAYKTITPKSIETKIPFIDETNKINFEFQYEPDGESFKKTVESATDVNKFLQSFVKSDGTFDKQEYLACIHFAKNRNAILTEAIKQSKNATIKASLPDNNGGAQRQFPQSQQPNEVDEMMRLHGIKRAS